jgi:hypothetical protein
MGGTSPVARVGVVAYAKIGVCLNGKLHLELAGKAIFC